MYVPSFSLPSFGLVAWVDGLSLDLLPGFLSFSVFLFFASGLFAAFEFAFLLLFLP